uniref:[histone H3]-trimethyl-L-lysine(9) demethylase n=1 Tax=Scleropages formosus TaxID=113540 RepID=A0A8C9VGW4_SCLFO
MASETGPQNPSSRGIMTFYPNKEEFKNFSRYIAYMESQGAHRAGLAKIVPPKDWKPRRSYDDIDDLVIAAPIQQVVTGQSGLFTQYNIQKKPMTVREFRRIANSDKFCTPRYVDFEELERKYWKNLTFNPPIYGADVNGTLYDQDVMEWNIGHLHTILDTVERESGITIEGVNTPYLYFGMWKTTFAWHTEDMDLYSINYLHFGEPKSWYCVPPEHGKRLERLAKGFFPGSSQNCEAFLRHKMTLISPSILKKYGIPFEKITQEAGEFMVTFPYGYHAGFNHGFNCAESTNFATQRWIEYGCWFSCERYKLWKAGKDLVPIDHTKPTPEAAEFLEEKRSTSRQRIGTKRHRVCLEVPEEVLPKDEETQLEDRAGKRISTVAEEECTDRASHEEKSDLHQEALGRCGMVAGPSGNFRPAPKAGVASLLFHRSLSPSDALSYWTVSLHQEMEPGAENKNMKSKRQPLSKLPRLHPLIKDCVSEEEMQEQTAEEDTEDQETETWAKSLAQLWQNRPHNFEAEKEYNQRMGQQAPYCAVCLLFHTYQQYENGGQPLQEPSGVRPRTKPLIPEMCFSSTTSSEVDLTTPYVEEDGTSLLVSCSRCCVRVHTSCYGVPPEKVSEGWKCSRCEADALTQDCCLCSLRGGALQKANNDKWVHVLCAVAVLEARFVNLSDRGPVDLSSIPLRRFKLKCSFCKRRMKRTSGCCVQCSHGRCPTSFHATCAQAAGVLMHPDDWPFVVYITCWRHMGPMQAKVSDDPVGQKVICKHKNSRYYQCEVVKLTQATFYEVVFDDGSFSDNLFPQDIVNRDCVQLGPPLEGEVVQVRWTDGLIYGAKFVAAHFIPMYQVEFEDASQLTAKRDDVYTLDEELPKRVKARLSVASDMRFNGIFTEPEGKRDAKRQRVISSRYRGDYVEPVLYRAIME